MNINNNDLEFLVHLENRLGASESWSEDVRRLWELNEKLINQRNVQREKTRVIIANGRKQDKNYGRSKTVLNTTTM